MSRLPVVESTHADGAACASRSSTARRAASPGAGAPLDGADASTTRLPSGISAGVSAFNSSSVTPSSSRSVMAYSVSIPGTGSPVR